jgi:hypothetical protein
MRAMMKALAFLAFLSCSASAFPKDPAYDLYLKSDYGRAKLWINTRTGEFRWEDTAKNLDVMGTGRLAFPNLGPVVFFFAGSAPGYDWVSISVKIYGTRASGYLAAFPEGLPVRKVVSNFYDRNTRDDQPDQERKRRRDNQPPKVEGIRPHGSEVPLPTPPSPEKSPTETSPKH